MLKEILFVSVTASLLTTPTRAYEAFNVNHTEIAKKTQTVTPSIQSKNIQNIVAVPLKQRTDANICALAAQHAEIKYDIKPFLVQTIASVESGKWDKKSAQLVAWPWTVQANGKGRYYKTKDEAVVAVKDLMAQSITDIDVGCMQVNLKYHGHAFKNIEEALDPEKNVLYGASFLKKLYMQSNNSWQQAAMQYHSKNHKKGNIYRKRLERNYAKHINPEDMQNLLD